MAAGALIAVPLNAPRTGLSHARGPLWRSYVDRAGFWLLSSVLGMTLGPLSGSLRGFLCGSSLSPVLGNCAPFAKRLRGGMTDTGSECT